MTNPLEGRLLGRIASDETADIYAGCVWRLEHGNKVFTPTQETHFAALSLTYGPPPILWLWACLTGSNDCECPSSFHKSAKKITGMKFDYEALDTFASEYALWYFTQMRASNPRWRSLIKAQLRCITGDPK